MAAKTQNFPNSTKQTHNSPKFRLLFLLIACFIGPSLASAATYYLDAVNGNNDNPGTSVQPWQTLSKAQSTVTGGDTVIVRNGSYGGYHEAGYNEATVDIRTDWLVYQAEDGHTPELTNIILDNQNGVYDVYLRFNGFKVRPSNDISKVINVRGSRYIDFLNCSIIGRGAKSTGCGIYIWGNSTDITIDNCSLYGDLDDSRFGGFTNAIYAFGGVDLTITDNEIRQMSGYGIAANCKDSTIARNHIHKIGGDGIYIGNGNGPLLIEDNIVHDLYIYRPTLSETPTATTWSADGKTMYNPNATWGTDEPIDCEDIMEIHLISGTNIRTGSSTGDYENRIEEVVSPTEVRFKNSIKGDPDGVTPSNVDYHLIVQTHGDLMQFAGETSNVTIRGNQFYDCYGQILWIQPRKYNNPPKDIGGHNFLVENNLCWNSYTDSQEEYCGTVCFEHIDGLTVRNNTFIGRLRFYQIGDANLYNNIVGYVQIGGSTAFTEHDYNIFCHGTFSDHSIGSNTTFLFPGNSWDRWRDPAFTSIFADYDNGNFRHASVASLGVGHGDPANYSAADILGVSRSIPPDAGCYEYGDTPSQPLISVSDQSVTEADSGTTDAVFTVSLSAAGDEIVTVNYATASGTATTADSDYTAVSGTLSFPVGTTERTITVSVNGDTNIESDETFYLNLSDPVNAPIALVVWPSLICVF